MIVLAFLSFARAELMYRVYLILLVVAGSGRESIGALLELYRAVEYWDRRRACSRARV